MLLGKKATLQLDPRQKHLEGEEIIKREIKKTDGKVVAKNTYRAKEKTSNG